MFKILIADDEPAERAMLAEIVEQRFGHEAQTRLVQNGRQAVDTAALWGAALILMDIEMPGLSGIEAARQILQQQLDCKVIFVTAFSLFTYAQEAIQLGACDYILKPVNADDLEKSIRLALNQLDSRQQLAAMAEQAMDSGASGDRTAVMMDNVKRYLEHNYMRYDLSPDSVSSILNINVSYFSVLFKKYLGVGFPEYVTRLRVQAAKELLGDPLRSTAEVAGMVGYESAACLTQAFKEGTGMTPAEYRRRSAYEKRGFSV